MPKLAFWFGPRSLESLDYIKNWIYKVVKSSQCKKIYAFIEDVYMQSRAKFWESGINASVELHKKRFVKFKGTLEDFINEARKPPMAILADKPDCCKKDFFFVHGVWLYLSTIPKDVVLKLPEVYPDDIAAEFKKYIYTKLSGQFIAETAEEKICQERRKTAINAIKETIESIKEKNEEADVLVVYGKAFSPIYDELKPFAERLGFDVDVTFMIDKRQH